MPRQQIDRIYNYALIVDCDVIVRPFKTGVETILTEMYYAKIHKRDLLYLNAGPDYCESYTCNHFRLDISANGDDGCVTENDVFESFKHIILVKMKTCNDKVIEKSFKDSPLAVVVG